MSLDYETLKRLAAELDRPVTTLLAQDAGSDPFYADLPMRRLRADWFADIWDRLDIKPGAHLRRIHYRLVSTTSPVRLPREVNGTWTYVNTYNCWQFLGDACSDARYLGLIPIDHISDQRNAGTVVNYTADEHDASVFVVDHDAADTTLDLSLSFWARVPTFPKLPSLNIVAPSIAQPYCIEVWVEKSTVDDVLAPLCRLHDVNFTSGTGDISITRCHDLIERARGHGKPVRVLTITDFDPGGSNMPVGLARKLEFLIRDAAPDLDVQVRAIALTRQQVKRYRLPGVPIKESNRQAAEFERRYGTARATELDALEALRPGQLRKIAEKEIRRYVDSDLDDNVESAHRDAQEALDEITARIHAERASELRQLRRKYDALSEKVEAEIAPFREQFERLQERCKQRFGAQFESLAEQAKALIRGLTASLEAAAADADDFDWPEPEPADEDPDPLFDSGRDFVRQADRYKAYQQKPTSRRERNGGAK
jgi:hypothetical protein